MQNCNADGQKDGAKSRRKSGSGSLRGPRSPSRRSAAPHMAIPLFDKFGILNNRKQQLSGNMSYGVQGLFRW
jgi:hypothetical protein